MLRNGESCSRRNGGLIHNLINPLVIADRGEAEMI